MHVAISDTIPRFEKLTSKKQEQRSHELKYISKLLEVSLLILIFCTLVFQASNSFFRVYSNVNQCHYFLSICLIIFTY